MTEIIAGLKFVEIVLLAGVALVFIVHPAVFILASLRAVVLGVVNRERVAVPIGEPVPVGA